MSKFQTIEFYKEEKNNYNLLPFRFSNLSDDSILLTNLVGEYFISSRETLEDLVKHKLKKNDLNYKLLRSKHFLYDEQTKVAKDLLSIKYKTKLNNLSQFTSLHMFVVSLRCEHSCPYCQVSRQSDDKHKYDMSREVASKSIDLALNSPSKNIKIEMQGGESLLNFEIIQFIVEESKKRNTEKNLTFVIATNLALINKEILDYCHEHQIYISTSLDGPKEIHNKNRPRPGRNSYEKTIEGISLAREVLGLDKVSALMTTTQLSLNYPKEIINEYVKNNFNEIFLRPLSPYGFAIKTKKFSEYDVEQWFDFYKQGMEYIIELNRNGLPFKEFYTSIILRKIFTFDDPGYVDLMSPAGIGIAAVIYNYDGDVYASDESRMLAEMGDKKFKIGNVIDNTYEEIFFSEELLSPLEESFAYSAPMCNDCAFENYCGSDPVYHHAMHGDFVGRKPESEFCKRNMNIFKYIFNQMQSDPFIEKLFMSWIK